MKVRGKVRNPKAKRYRAIKQGKKEKYTKSKNMAVMKKKTAKSTIRKQIMEIKSKRMKTISELRKEIKRVESLIVSISGIENLSNSSMEQIQLKRLESSMRLVKIVSNLTVSTRKLSKLEKKYRK